MKIFFVMLSLFLAVPGFSQPRVVDKLGLQMYSLRATLADQGWFAALQQVHDFGFRSIEGSAPPKGLNIDQYKGELESRGIELIADAFSYESLAQDLDGAIANANRMFSQYAEVTWIPHPGDEFTEEQALKAAADFNKWGEAFKRANVTFIYHPHGYEFRPRPDGSTLFDLLVQKTNPKFVSFEMDVFWVTHAGQNPVKLLAKYPNRWRTMHIKDIRVGAETGIYTGHAPPEDDVAVGRGQVKWPEVLKKAQEVGVQWYFLEDESTEPLKNIPISLAYIKSLGL